MPCLLKTKIGFYYEKESMDLIETFLSTIFDILFQNINQLFFSFDIFNGVTAIG